MKYRCNRCHRPMKQDTDLGPKCRRIAAAAVQASDLFGFRLEVFAQELTDKAHSEVAQTFAAKLRERLEALA